MNKQIFKTDSSSWSEYTESSVWQTKSVPFCIENNQIFNCPISCDFNLQPYEHAMKLCSELKEIKWFVISTSSHETERWKKTFPSTHRFQKCVITKLDIKIPNKHANICPSSITLQNQDAQILNMSDSSSWTGPMAAPNARSVLTAPFSPCLWMWTRSEGISVIRGDYSMRASCNSFYGLWLDEESRHWGPAL